MKENNRRPHPNDKYLSGEVVKLNKDQVLAAMDEAGDSDYWRGIAVGILVMRLEQIEREEAEQLAAQSSQSPTATGNGYTDEMRRHDAYVRRTIDNSGHMSPHNKAAKRGNPEAWRRKGNTNGRK